MAVDLGRRRRTGCRDFRGVAAFPLAGAPIPESLMQPCPLPDPLPDGKLSTLYQQALQDASPSGPWALCIRNHDQLIAVVKYRDSICAHIAEMNKQPPAQWWQFWR